MKREKNVGEKKVTEKKEMRRTEGHRGLGLGKQRHTHTKY